MKVTDVPEDIKFYTETGRVIPLLRPSTPQRKMAERMLRQREQYGWTYAEIARHEKVAISTAFRLIRAARTTREVEAGERDTEIRRLTRQRSARKTARKARKGGNNHARRVAALA
jgi:hypothetical protein